jgi:hypothetical protein
MICGKESYKQRSCLSGSSGTRSLVVILELSPDSEGNSKIISRSRSEARIASEVSAQRWS